MSNNIYDILGKLDGLRPKENPTSASEPIYESIDPRGDIMTAVNQLEERYQGFKEAKAKRKEPEAVIPATDLTRSADPDVARLATKAKFIKPELNDFEAIVSYTSKLEKELEQAEQADVVDRQKIERLQQMLAKTQANQDAMQKIIAATDQRFRVVNDKIATGQITAQDQQAAIAAQQIEKDHDAAVAAIPQEPTDTVAQQPAPAPAPAPAQASNIYQFPDKQQSTAASADTQTGAGQSDNKISKDISKLGTEKVSQLQPTSRKPANDTLMTATPIARAAESKETKLKMLREYKEGDPDLGIINYNEALKAFQQAQEKITLDFGGKPLTLYDYQLYGLLTDLTMDQNQERKMSRIETVMSNYDNVVQLLMTPKVKKLIQKFPEYAKKNPRFKTRMRDVNRGQFKLEPAPPEDPRYDPRLDPTAPEFDQAYAATQPHPYQRSDSQLEETLGTKSMKNLEQIAESLMERFANFKEEAKPDFLDLDKDGDTEEPMKSAAKDAKEHEPAKVDKSAVEKRKRLQALKDKQEDERAERGDYDSKSSTRIVKGRAYGGAAQKDDEEKDLDESGLQAYLGKKKYGKEGMKALQKAGREGASKEKMALIRARHDKMDEVAPPGAKAERMVKGIKKSLSKDGHLSGKDKAIAYATTWKAHKKGQVEEATNFGDTIKNSKAKMTKVTVKEGKEDIRNHPIYTTKEAWDHYAQELAEQEAMETSMMETPVVDVQEELDEIAKLAGLAPKMEAKSVCPSCNCESCECNENLAPMAPSDSASPLTHTEEGAGCMIDEAAISEAATRKDFRAVANLLKNIPDEAKRKELAHHHADIFKQQNPRFKKEMFLAAAGVNESSCTMEDEVEEGNEFSGALAKARAAGSKEFEVDGKKYTVKEDININVSANGEEDVVNLIRKLSGMPVVAIQAQPAVAEEVVAEEGPKERDVEYTNTPREDVAGIDAAIPAGADLNRAKKQFRKEYPGDNPMAVKEAALWEAYETMITDLKA